jgi:hypothetical protein
MGIEDSAVPRTRSQNGARSWCASPQHCQPADYYSMYYIRNTSTCVLSTIDFRHHSC